MLSSFPVWNVMEYLPGYEIHGVYSLWTFKVWCSKTCLRTLLYHAWSRQNRPWTLGLDPLPLPRPFLTRTLRLLFEDCPSVYFHLLMKSAFLPSWGLLCLYDKQNRTWLLVGIEFLFSCSTRHLTHSLRSLMSYRVKHWKRNSISKRVHVLFSIYQLN